jgi:hypothetical protein
MNDPTLLSRQTTSRARAAHCAHCKGLGDLAPQTAEHDEAITTFVQSWASEHGYALTQNGNRMHLVADVESGGSRPQNACGGPASKPAPAASTSPSSRPASSSASDESKAISR